MSKYNYSEANNNVNQRIKGQFVEREVYACLTSEVEFILSTERVNAPFRYDDIENYYTSICPECGGQIEETEDEDGNTIYKCESCDFTSEDEPDTEPPEIYEWYLISKYLAESLRDKKQPVIINYLSCYWGRCCSGQAILLDSVITDICADTEILQGQKNEWKLN